MFNLAMRFKVICAVILAILNTTNCINLCGDWTEFETTKCFKVIAKASLQQEAYGECRQLDQKSTLPSIHSEEEQEFIENLVKKYENISYNVWLGMRFNGREYAWGDGTGRGDTGYTNWASDAVRDGKDECVQMSLSDNTLGKWTDVSCAKTALILCQRKQELDFNILRKAFEEQQKTIDSLKEEIKSFKIDSNTVNSFKIEFLEKHINQLQEQFKAETNRQNRNDQLTQIILHKINSIIPLGFLYTQFPNQSKPEELWPNTKWSEITSQYSGLFFRAEGGGSEHFGQIQHANQSWISEVYLKGAHFHLKDHTVVEKTTVLKQEKWVDSEPIGKNYLAVGHLSFHTTGGEVRPKNTAIKIWKRIQ